jgi:hypothetical protein
LDKPLVERIPFAKIVAVLAIVFGISLGLCGVTYVAAVAAKGGDFVVIFGVIELAGMALSAAGLVLTLIVWVILAIAANFTRESSGEPSDDPADDDNPL